jgi:broad-specificity NMP kinase
MHNDAKKSELEVKKLETEIAKATLEVAELRKPWFRKPSLLQQIIAILILVLTGVFGYVNGWFSTKLESLNNARDKAQTSLHEMEEKRSALNIEIAGFNSQVIDLKSHVAGLQSQVVVLTSQRDKLEERLKEALERVQKLQENYETASAGAAQGEACYRELGKIRSQLQQTATALAATNVTPVGKWQEGNVISIHVFAEPSEGGGSDFIMSYPVLPEDRGILANAGPSGTAFVANLPSTFAPDCRQHFGGTCQYKVGALAIALDYVRIHVAPDDAYHEPKTLLIQNGTRDVNVTLRRYYTGHNL